MEGREDKEERRGMVRRGIWDEERGERGTEGMEVREEREDKEEWRGKVRRAGR